MEKILIIYDTRTVEDRGASDGDSPFVFAIKAAGRDKILHADTVILLGTDGQPISSGLGRVVKHRDSNAYDIEYEVLLG